MLAALYRIILVAMWELDWRGGSLPSYRQGEGEALVGHQRNMSMEAQMICPNTPVGHTNHSSVTWKETQKNTCGPFGKPCFEMPDPMPRSGVTELGQNHASPQSTPRPVRGRSDRLTSYNKTRQRAPHALQEALSQGQCHCGPTLGRRCRLRSDNPLRGRRGCALL